MTTRFVLSWVLLFGLSIACSDDSGGSSGNNSDAGADGGISCSDDRACDDGIYCNGVESCVAGLCADGDPIACDDGIECTVDVCSEARQTCVSRAPDEDGDGFRDATCTDAEDRPLGDDCDDTDPKRFPGNLEVCDPDNRDEDCNEDTYGAVDADVDGYDDARCCNGDNCGTDCQDALADVNTAGQEICDGRDNDCDGLVDEGVTSSGYLDADGDGDGEAGSALQMNVCPGRRGVSQTNTDCDDNNPARNGNQVEVCDGVDNDCDNAVDEADNEVTWYVDADGDGFGSAPTTKDECPQPPGFSLLNTDCNDNDAAINPAATELCDGKDNDCNGLRDYQIGVNDFEDDDLDGLVDGACTPLGTDCDDLNPYVGAGQPERCDAQDNDCDGSVDEGAKDGTWYLDADGDGFGSTSASTVISCDPVIGHVRRGGDCSDDDESQNPESSEVCNGSDDDCDGVSDESPAVLSCQLDQAAAACSEGACAIKTCAQGWGDCNDDAEDGCETALDSVQHCGGCGMACDDTNADSTMCVAGTCVVNCANGFEDCDADPSNGCESTDCGGDACPPYLATCANEDPGECINLANDRDNCGACGVSCPQSVAKGQTRCDSGVCEVIACNAPYADCDDDAGNGCEASLVIDSRHCGGCGLNCPIGAACSLGMCSNIVQQTFGDSHSCVRFQNGTVTCWGNDANGEVTGNPGLPAAVTTPIAVQAGAIDVAAGFSHTCAALANGSIRCWGRNTSYRLGSPDQSVEDHTFSIPGETPVEVSLGANHSCAAMLSGKVFCWGSNASFQLGNNTVGLPTHEPQEVSGVVATGGTGVITTRRLASGRNFTCAKHDEGGQAKVRCWGANDKGQLGRGGSTTVRELPGAIVIQGVPSAPPVTQIVAGENHVCGYFTYNGSAIACWGANERSQLGRSTAPNDYSTEPYPISIGGGLNGYFMMAGRAHVCTALSPAGYCWGDNAYGQSRLGPGADKYDTPTQSTFDPTSFSLMIQTTAPFADHACAQGGDDAFNLDYECWGRNFNGAVGVGTTPGPVYTPTQPSKLYE